MRSESQRTLCQMRDRWWCSFAGEMQGYADMNDKYNFYNSVKLVTGPELNNLAIVKDSQGNILRDRASVLDRWKEYFSDVLTYWSASHHKQQYSVWTRYQILVRLLMLSVPSRTINLLDQTHCYQSFLNTGVSVWPPCCTS